MTLNKNIFYKAHSFGDGSHLTNSLSMVNLATTTMIQRDDAFRVTKEERFVSISSWDGNEIPVATVSDSGLVVPYSVANEPRNSLLSLATWNRYCLANKERKSEKRSHTPHQQVSTLIETRAEINNAQVLQTVLAQQGLADILTETSNSKIQNVPDDENGIISMKNVDDKSSKKSNEFKLSKRVSKAFQRMVCSCMFRRVKKR